MNAIAFGTPEQPDRSSTHLSEDSFTSARKMSSLVKGLREDTQTKAEALSAILENGASLLGDLQGHGSRAYAREIAQIAKDSAVEYGKDLANRVVALQHSDDPQELLKAISLCKRQISMARNGLFAQGDQDIVAKPLKEEVLQTAADTSKEAIDAAQERLNAIPERAKEFLAARDAAGLAALAEEKKEILDQIGILHVAHQKAIAKQTGVETGEILDEGLTRVQKLYRTLSGEKSEEATRFAAGLHAAISSKTEEYARELVMKLHAENDRCLLDENYERSIALLGVLSELKKAGFDISKSSPQAEISQQPSVEQVPAQGAPLTGGTSPQPVQPVLSGLDDWVAQQPASETGQTDTAPKSESTVQAATGPRQMTLDEVEEPTTSSEQGAGQSTGAAPVETQEKPVNEPEVIEPAPGSINLNKKKTGFFDFLRGLFSRKRQDPAQVRKDNHQRQVDTYSKTPKGAELLTKFNRAFDAMVLDRGEDLTLSEIQRMQHNFSTLAFESYDRSRALMRSISDFRAEHGLTSQPYGAWEDSIVMDTREGDKAPIDTVLRLIREKTQAKIAELQQRAA